MACSTVQAHYTELLNSRYDIGLIESRLVPISILARDANGVTSIKTDEQLGITQKVRSPTSDDWKLLSFEMETKDKVNTLHQLEKYADFLHSITVVGETPEQKYSIELYSNSKLLTRGVDSLVFNQPLALHICQFSLFEYKIVPINDGTSSTEDDSVKLVFSLSMRRTLPSLGIPVTSEKGTYFTFKMSDISSAVKDVLQEPHIVEVSNGDRLLVANCHVSKTSSA